MSTAEADLPERSVDETQEDLEDSEEYVEQGDANGSSSISNGRNEAESNKVNCDQQIVQFAPSILQSAAVTSASASVTPISIGQSQATRTLASTSPLFLCAPPMREAVSPQAGMFQTQQDREISLINRNQVSFTSQGLFDGERLINHVPPFPGDHHHQAMRIGPTNNNYQLPTSSLPSDFRLDSSSARRAAPLIHPFPQSQATIRNENIGSFIQGPHWANRPHQNQSSLTDLPPIFGQQEYEMQAVMDSGFGSPNFHHGAVSHHMQTVNFPPQTGAPLGNSLPFQPEVGMSSNYHNDKMGIHWSANIPPTPNLPQVNWNPPGPNLPIPTSLADPRGPKNSLYDPLYETMGLPVDPHLRMFLAGSQ